MNGRVTIKIRSTFTVKKLTAKVSLDYRKSLLTGILQKVCIFPRNCVIVSFIPSFILLTVTFILLTKTIGTIKTKITDTYVK